MTVGGVENRHLLRPDAHDHVVTCCTRSRGRHHISLPIGSHQNIVTAAPLSDTVDKIRLAQKVCNKHSFRQLIDISRVTQLLYPASVHDRDGVGHGHGLLLIMGNVHKGGANFTLNALELNLHLAAQFEVECAKRLIK